MICPYCKMKIKDNSSYCIVCGKIFYLEDVGYDSPKMEKELFLLYYKNGKIPWQIHRISCGYLFLSFIYAFYKKLYIEGFISMVTTTVLLYFLFFGVEIVLGSMGFYFYIVISIIILTIGIHLYYLFNISYLKFKYVRTTISRTMIDYKDDEEKQKEICLKDSKNNLWAAIIGIFIFALLLLLVLG